MSTLFRRPSRAYPARPEVFRDISRVSGLKLSTLARVNCPVATRSVSRYSEAPWPTNDPRFHSVDQSSSRSSLFPPPSPPSTSKNQQTLLRATRNQVRRKGSRTAYDSIIPSHLTYRKPIWVDRGTMGRSDLSAGRRAAKKSLQNRHRKSERHGMTQTRRMI
ncbi:hypothetical protein L228DRAFT_238292 [Xylona heveae TC161]|uniref:Uncharacterized protein n=1 Tax=Xylona heveae (strain CBS 132557 / TC161) TaxID=1328760 RepID=A0A165HNB2_XYLHT|nr:hypothetical protein L228DRAFT_238292 [Xylona heveae TC161]KZF23770.1 hypothetical protein L228DRAFT_238292 [Xylona heveae TC161]